MKIKVELNEVDYGNMFQIDFSFGKGHAMYRNYLRIPKKENPLVVALAMEELASQIKKRFLKNLPLQ